MSELFILTPASKLQFHVFNNKLIKTDLVVFVATILCNSSPYLQADFWFYNTANPNPRLGLYRKKEINEMNQTLGTVYKPYSCTDSSIGVL